MSLPKKSNWKHPLPTIAVRGVLITASAGDIAVDLDADLAETLHAVYPAISWIELIDWMTSGLFDSEAGPRLMSLYGYRWNDDLKHIAKMELSSAAKTWLAEKNLGPREIGPLMIVPRLELQSAVVEQIASSGATRSEGTRLIELISEILAMPIKTSAEFEVDFGLESGPIGNWILKLEAIRFPTTSRRDTQMADRLKNLDLPLKVKAEFRRNGDETGVELKILARAPHEMRQLLSDLNTKPWDDAWKSNSLSK